MRISDWSSDVCSSDLSKTGFTKSRGDREILTHQIQAKGPFARFRIFHHGNVADPVGRFEQQADACIVFMDVAEARAVIQSGVAGVLAPNQASNAQRDPTVDDRSAENTYELKSLMRNSYAVFCLTNNTQHPNSRQ